MRWAKDSIVCYRHDLLREFIVKKLKEAQVYADDVREKASRAIRRWTTDPLCKLIVEEWMSKSVAVWIR